MNIFLALLVVLFGIGAIADKEQQNRNNFTMICIACIAAITIINIF